MSFTVHFEFKRWQQKNNPYLFLMSIWKVQRFKRRCYTTSIPFKKIESKTEKKYLLPIFLASWVLFLLFVCFEVFEYITS